MAYRNPRIQAQRELLERLVATEFVIDESNGILNSFGDWIPNPQFYRGIESFRQVLLEELWKLENETDGAADEAK